MSRTRRWLIPALVALFAAGRVWAAPAEGVVFYPREMARETAPAAAALAKALGTEARAGEAGEGDLQLALDPSSEDVAFAPDRISAPSPAAGSQV